MRQTKIALVIMLTLVVILQTVCIVEAQTLTPSPTLTPRQKLEQEIIGRAYRDIELARIPADATTLNLMFGADAQAIGMTLRDVLETYDNAYALARPKPSLAGDLSRLLAPFGWIVAIIMFIILLFQGFLKKRLELGLDKIFSLLLGKLAGYRFLHLAALRRYRSATVKKYSKLVVPFRPERPLDLQGVFVPLRVTGGAEVEPIDASIAVAKYRHLMIVGEPGSGKSTLSRHFLLQYGLGRFSIGRAGVVPVLLELNRLNGSKLTIEEHLIDAFKRNGFPKAGRFVENALNQGDLFLLFDGLDEVNTSEREAVVAQIRDFTDLYERCRVVVTCRRAVYHQELDDIVDATLELMEFNDHQIRSYLNIWEKSMPLGKTADALVTTLRDRPNILALARNPLLLTIIAYLYADTEFVLPNSRAEFYQAATNVLLQTWKSERNYYKAQDKATVLKSLALQLQDSDEQLNDRRSIGYDAILAAITLVLPNLNLEPSDAKPLLDEIVERSGMLLSIDGGSRYQFAHLSLQEYFAAQALFDDDNGLIARYSVDPDKWREVVKLWCGLEHASTNLIQIVRTIDPLTAFECLGDTHYVDPILAEEIVNEMLGKLDESGISNLAIVRAFAAVAGDPRTRGVRVFRILVESLSGQKSEFRQRAAIWSLAYTNRPEAADSLAKYYGQIDDISGALVHMGDISVPTLANLARQGNLDAINNLAEINSPASAAALVPLLWGKSNESENVGVDFGTQQPCQVQAAWRLASLIAQPDIERAIQQMKLEDYMRTESWYDWVWEPFSEPKTSPLPLIAGRVAFLLHNCESTSLPNDLRTVDVRIALPVCAILEATQLKALLDWKPLKSVLSAPYSFQYSYSHTPLNVDLEKFGKDTNFTVIEDTYVAGVKLSEELEVFSRLQREHIKGLVDDKWALLFLKMPVLSRIYFLLNLMHRNGKTTIAEWKRMEKRQYFSIVESPHCYSLMVMFVWLLAVVIWFAFLEGDLVSVTAYLLCFAAFAALWNRAPRKWLRRLRISSLRHMGGTRRVFDNRFLEGWSVARTVFFQVSPILVTGLTALLVWYSWLNQEYLVVILLGAYWLVAIITYRHAIELDKRNHNPFEGVNNSERVAIQIDVDGFGCALICAPRAFEMLNLQSQPPAKPL